MRNKYYFSQLLFILVFSSDSEFADGVISVRDIPYRQIRGYEQHLTMLDIHRPTEGELLPVVVFIHGGTWIQGDKRGADNKIDFFTSNDFVLVSLNYRLSPDVVYPEHAYNIASAIDQINRLNITEWSHMSMQRGFQYSELIRAEPENEFIFRMVLGNEPEQWDKVSPVAYTSSDAIPFLIIYAGYRAISRRAAEEFGAELSRNGVSVLLYYSNNRDHISFERHLGEDGDQAGMVILGFLNQISFNSDQLQDK